MRRTTRAHDEALEERTMTQASMQKLVSDLKVLIDDAEALVRESAGQAGEKAAALRARMQQATADLKPRLARAEALLEERAKAAAENADSYVRANPWTAMEIAAGAGLLLGILAARR